MHQLITRAALLALLLIPETAHAQGFARYGFVRVGRNGFIALPGAGLPGVGYIGTGPCYNPYAYSSFRQVTVIYTPPPPPPLIFVPPPVVIREDPRVIVERPRQPDPPPPDPIPPGQPAGAFKALAPDNRALARRPVQPETDEPPELARDAPLRSLPADASLIDRGRLAFAAGEHGRAADFFRRATIAEPKDGLARFLLGQSLFALGKYREAVEAIESGLLLRPDWPATAFRPRELYEPPPNDYTEHLRMLDEVLACRADDPVLLFLYGYQLWLDGRRAEARGVLQRAKKNGADPAAVELFLRAGPVREI